MKMIKKTNKFTILEPSKAFSTRNKLDKVSKESQSCEDVIEKEEEQSEILDEFGQEISGPKTIKWYDKYLIPPGRVIKENNASELLQEKNRVFVSLFKAYSTSKVAYKSKSEREDYKQSFDDTPSHPTDENQFPATSMMSLTYGEMIDIYPLHTLFLLLKKKKLLPKPRQGIFYDLGSGSGRIVVAASLLYPFKELVGIEILGSLVDISVDVKENLEKKLLGSKADTLHSDEKSIILDYTDLLQQDEDDSSFDGANCSPKIHLFHNSILNNLSAPSIQSNNIINPLNWLQGNLIFINSTCFDQELMKQISFHCQFLQSGTIVITLTNMLLPISQCETLHELRLDMSW
jgi:SAM-dependent methyltransferase